MDLNFDENDDNGDNNMFAQFRAMPFFFYCLAICENLITFYFVSYVRDDRMTIDSDPPNLSPMVGGKRRREKREGRRERNGGERIHFCLFI